MVDGMDVQGAVVMWSTLYKTGQSYFLLPVNALKRITSVKNLKKLF
jgi:hypothetical protein